MAEIRDVVASVKKMRTHKDAKEFISEKMDELFARATVKSDAVRALIRHISKCRQRSFKNAMLVFMQNPGATHLFGKMTWEKMGYVVNESARPIYTLSPIRLFRGSHESVKAWLADNPFAIAMKRASASGKDPHFDEAQKKRSFLCSKAPHVAWASKANFVYPPYRPTPDMIRKMQDAGIVGKNFADECETWRARMEDIPYEGTYVYFKSVELYDVADVTQDPEKAKENVAHIELLSPSSAPKDSVHALLIDAFPKYISVRSEPLDAYVTHRCDESGIIVNSKLQEESRQLALIRGWVDFELENEKSKPSPTIAQKEIAATIICDTLGIENPYFAALSDVTGTSSKDIYEAFHRIHYVVESVEESIYNAYVRYANHQIETLSTETVRADDFFDMAAMER